MDQSRNRKLNNQEYAKGAVVYWMQREHRVQDNWSLLFAQEYALRKQVPLVVVFCIRSAFRDATERLISFMFAGLQEIEEALGTHNIPFFFLLGNPIEEIPKFLKEQQAGALVTDFHSLRTERAWRENIAKKITIPLYEVDSRNIIPCWVASPKQEFAAYTFRPKVHRLLPKYLTEFPALKKQKTELMVASNKINWENMYQNMQVDTHVKKITWLSPGEKAAKNMLEQFLEMKLHTYHQDRNDPTKDAQSHMSPYLHFGHISAQRVVLAVHAQKNDIKAEEAFIEEITVRRELADNYCYYNNDYDTPQGFPAWAKNSLEEHQHDTHEYVYTLEDLESAKTHDDLWNAAQHEAVTHGIMHGWMRMYWAKKILEWTPSPKEAMQCATHLMDRYFIDGRESNGFTGIAWAIGGVHDRAWFDRNIFGKVRYMNYNGAKAKFDVGAYIQNVAAY